MSAADIEKGARWSSDIAYQLKETRVGVVCLTPENLEAPWILFEAGALSKKLDRTLVCPYLFELEPSTVSGPLVQFQATRAERNETMKLLGTINRALGTGSLAEGQIERAFEKWWPELDSRLKAIPASGSTKPVRRSEREILEEMLELMRMQVRHASFQGQDAPLAWSHLLHLMESGPRLLNEYKRRRLGPLKSAADQDLTQILTRIELEVSSLDSKWHELISRSESIQRRLDLLYDSGEENLSGILMWMAEWGNLEDLELIRYLRTAHPSSSKEVDRLFESCDRAITKRGS